LEDWVSAHPWSRVIPDYNHAIDEARRQFKVATVAAVGFCWGGAAAQEIACTTLLPETGPAAGSAIMHGCYMRMHENYKRLIRPAAYFCGGDDGATPEEKRNMVEGAFKRSTTVVGKRRHLNQMHVYPGQRHFFCVPRPSQRKDTAVLQAAQTCLEDVIQYLDELVAADIEAASVGEAEAADGAGRGPQAVSGAGGAGAGNRNTHEVSKRSGRGIAGGETASPRDPKRRRTPTPAGAGQ